MTDCWKCMRLLPYKCICPTTKEEKFRQLCDVARREMDLMLAILDGYQPVLHAGGVDWPVDVRITEGGALIFVKAKIIAKDWRKIGNIVLMDVEGRPLYRQTRTSLDVRTRKGDSLTFTWDLSINRP